MPINPLYRGPSEYPDVTNKRSGIEDLQPVAPKDSGIGFFEKPNVLSQAFTFFGKTIWNKKFWTIHPQQLSLAGPILACTSTQESTEEEEEPTQCGEVSAVGPSEPTATKIPFDKENPCNSRITDEGLTGCGDQHKWLLEGCPTNFESLDTSVPSIREQYAYGHPIEFAHCSVRMLFAVNSNGVRSSLTGFSDVDWICNLLKGAVDGNFQVSIEVTTGVQLSNNTPESPVFDLGADFPGIPTNSSTSLQTNPKTGQQNVNAAMVNSNYLLSSM